VAVPGTDEVEEADGMRLSPVEDLRRDTLAGTNGPVDRAVRDGGRLGARPVHATERLPQQMSVACERAEREMRHRASARPFLFPPRGLDELSGVRRATTESSGERLEH